MLGIVAIPVKAWVDPEVKNPLGYGRISSSGYPEGTVRNDLAPPPPFFSLSRPALKVGEERDEFSPIEVSLPEEVPEKKSV